MAWLMTQCIAIAVTAPILHAQAVEGAGELKIRPAAVAGAFYPVDPQALSQMMDDMLAKAKPRSHRWRDSRGSRAACGISLFRSRRRLDIRRS